MWIRIVKTSIIWSSSTFKTWLNCDSLTPSLNRRKTKWQEDQQELSVNVQPFQNHYKWYNILTVETTGLLVNKYEIESSSICWKTYHVEKPVLKLQNKA